MLIARPSSTAFDSLSRIIPHSFHKDHTHPKNSHLESNQVWLEHHLAQFRGHGYSNRFVLCAEVYSFTHTIRTSRPDQGTEGRNEVYSFTSPPKSRYGDDRWHTPAVPGTQVCMSTPAVPGTRVTRTSSPRSFARPAYGLHGTCRKGDPNVEPPNVRSARSRSSLEHVRRVTRTSSPRTFARPAYGLHGTCWKGDPNVELPNVRSLVALMEHAGEESPNVEPNVRSTRLWLSWSTPDGNPSVEPPSVRSARLWPSWSTPDGNPSVEPPSVRSARLWASRRTPED